MGCALYLVPEGASLVLNSSWIDHLINVAKAFRDAVAVSCSVFRPVLSVFSSTAAQLRKVPLKKPDGEIKPYSSMEREGKRSYT